MQSRFLVVKSFLGYCLLALLTASLALFAFVPSSGAQPDPDDYIVNTPLEDPRGDLSTGPYSVNQRLLTKQEKARQVMDQIDQLQKQLEITVEDYNGIREELKNTEEKLADISSQLRRRRKTYNKQLDFYEQRLTLIYKNGKVNVIDVLLNTESFSDFLNRFYLLTVIGQRDAKVVELLRLEKRQLEFLKNESEEMLAKQAQLESDLKTRQLSIEGQMSQLSKVLKGIEADIRAIIEQENDLMAKEQLQRLEELKIRALSGETGLRTLVDPTSVVNTALQYLGVPYLWGGEDPEKGLDCSGLSLLVFRQHGVILPHYSRSQFKLGEPVEKENLQPGDLVFFGSPIHHLGIYMGSDLFIHAPRTGDVVKISKFSDRKDFAGARRYPLLSRE